MAVGTCGIPIPTTDELFLTKISFLPLGTEKVSDFRPCSKCRKKTLFYLDHE